jgi:hypothetical protein
MRKPNLSLGILVRLVGVLAGGALFLPVSTKAGYIVQDSINHEVVSFNQELGVKKDAVILIDNACAIVAPFASRSAVTPEQGSVALLGLGALLVALGYKKRRS